MNERKTTGKVLQVRIPNYLTKIKTSDSRRKKYWLEKDKDKLPSKFKLEDHGFGFIKGKLCNLITKEPVVRNSKSLDTPNYQMINGNEIMRMHDMIRVNIVNELKEHFTTHIKKQPPILFFNPVIIRMQFRGHFGNANQDVDNMWIYHKCFIDALVDNGVIENDNVLHVRKAGGTEFIPIPESEPTEMVFTIEELDLSAERTTLSPVTLLESNAPKPGEILVQEEQVNKTTHRILLGVGKKKVIFGAAKKSIHRAMFYCLNNFKSPMVSQELYDKYKNFFERFEDYRIKIIRTP